MKRLSSGYIYDNIEDESIDLYHANGVFVLHVHLVTYRNLVEAVRVPRPGGVIAFDFLGMEEVPEIFEFNLFASMRFHSRRNIGK